MTLLKYKNDEFFKKDLIKKNLNSFHEVPAEFRGGTKKLSVLQYYLLIILGILCIYI